jgi:hypothetical protein
MTEREWLESTYPKLMLELLTIKASERKLRLFAVACCRRVWRSFEDERSKTAVDVAEQLADGLATRLEVRRACDGALAAVWDVPKCAATIALMRPRKAAYRSLGTGLRFRSRNAVKVAEDAAGASAWCSHSDWEVGVQAEAASQAVLLRDIFHDPFYPLPAIDPTWLVWNDSTILKLARTIYEGLAFDRLAVLGDALEEAGCSNEEILGHCRTQGSHFKGCWLLDLLLGKE